jgi:hypothetical protein
VIGHAAVGGGRAFAYCLAAAAIGPLALRPAAAARPVTRPAARSTPLPAGAGARGPSFQGIYGVEIGGEADASGAADASSPAADGSGGPSTHTVQQGDTLWGISESYFRDPWRWPKLWAENPEITNPHWIFPGQVVRLRAQRGSGPLDAAAEAAAAPAPNGPPQRRAAQAPVEGHRLRQLGFVDEGTLAAAGVIDGSLEEKIMLVSGDHAYVQFPGGRAPAGRGRYTVYQVDREHPIRAPGSSAVIGYLVHVYGETVVESSGDHPLASARLVDLAGPVERGYQVGPLRRRFQSVVPKPNQAAATARVVASVEPNMLIASEMFVVLDRGRRHGVDVGNRFLVTRQGDGLPRIFERGDEADPRFPLHAVAEILAVDVQEQTTVGWVSRGSRELHVGDVADMPRGY